MANRAIAMQLLRSKLVVVLEEQKAQRVGDVLVLAAWCSAVHRSALLLLLLLCALELCQHVSGKLTWWREPFCTGLSQDACRMQTGCALCLRACRWQRSGETSWWRSGAARYATTCSSLTSW